MKITKVEYETLANLCCSLRQFLDFSEEAANQAGVPSQQHHALLAFKGFPEGRSITAEGVAERLQVRHHSAVGLVDRLVLKNFIARKQHTVDRRQLCLTLTDLGQNVLENFPPQTKNNCVA